MEGVIRIEAARKLGIKEIPCIVVEHLSATETNCFRVTANRLQERGSWDLEVLGQAFKEMITAKFEVDVTGFTQTEIDIIIQDDESGDLLGKPQPIDRTKATIAKPGVIFELGPHLIVCGDARDHATLNSIMDVGPARLVLTDQPYNVPIGGHVTRGQHREFAMASGEMSEAEFANFNREWIKAAVEHLQDGGILTTFIDWGSLASVSSAALAE